MSSSPSRRRSGSKRQIRDKIDASLLSSCEPEIQELLRQVDGLLDSKRSEWESRVAGLKKQLQRRDGELCALRAALQRKSTEVERLQAKFEDAETQQEEQMSSYEVQLTTLKTELSRLSRKHEKLQTKKEHQMDGIDRERQKVSEDYRFANQELQHLRKAFEELHVKSLLWDKEKTLLEKAAEQAVAESEAMRSRCVYLEECNATYQRDLERYKRLQLNSEQTHKVHIAQMEAKVKLNQQESDNKQDGMSRLQSTLTETFAKLRRKSGECERLHSELATNSDSLDTLRKENTQLQCELQQRDQQLKSVEKSRSRLSRETTELRESLQSKDDVITVLEDRGKRGSSPETTLLKANLSRSQTTVRTLTMKQKELTEEVKCQQQLVDSLKQQCHLLQSKLNHKGETLQNSHTKALELRDDEITQLRLRAQELEEERHTFLSDMSKLRSELADREGKNAAFVGQLNTLEQQNRTRQATLDRLTDNLKVANSQIKVLRHENKSLRDAAESTMQNDQHDVEESLVEINNQLQSATISALEDENSHLKSKVDELESSLSKLKQEHCESVIISDRALHGVETNRFELKETGEEVGVGVELSDGHFGLEDVLQHDNGNLLLEESPILIQSSPDDHQAVPLMTSSRKSVVLSHPSSLEDYGPELNVSGSAHSYVVGSLSDSSLCVTPLSSESHWSLKSEDLDMAGIFKTDELDKVLDARISAFESSVDINGDQFNQ